MVLIPKTSLNYCHLLSLPRYRGHRCCHAVPDPCPSRTAHVVPHHRSIANGIKSTSSRTSSPVLRSSVSESNHHFLEDKILFLGLLPSLVNYAPVGTTYMYHTHRRNSVIKLRS